MAEAYDYRREAVYGANGEQVDVARFRRNRGESWDTAQFRGTGEYAGRAGRVRRAERSAAGRSAARNPAMRTNRYGRRR